MNTFSNYFTGSGEMNIAQGKDAIASQINTITVQQDGKTRTVVSQQISGKGNTCSGTGSVVINGVRMQGGESVTVIDGNVFINKKAGKMKQNNSRDYKDIIDDIKAEVLREHGNKGQGFIDALESLAKKVTSKGRQETLSEEVESLQLEKNATVMALISELILCTNSAKDQKKSEVDQLRKETASVALKIQEAHGALVDIIAAECESSAPDFELAERAKYAIKLLTGQE